MGWYDRKVRRVRDLSCGDTRIFLELEVRRIDCRGCGKVKREQLDFLADNPLYTKRFAYSVGAATMRRSRTLRRNWGSTGTPSKRSRCSTCKLSSSVPARLRRGKIDMVEPAAEVRASPPGRTVGRKRCGAPLRQERS